MTDRDLGRALLDLDASTISGKSDITAKTEQILARYYPNNQTSPRLLQLLQTFNSRPSCRTHSCNGSFCSEHTLMNAAVV